MIEGHEGCGHDVEIIKSMNGDQWNIVKCMHDHLTHVRADDMLGTGPIVADYCECCGEMMRREDWK